MQSVQARGQSKIQNLKLPQPPFCNGPRTADHGPWTTDYGLRTKDYGPRTTDSLALLLEQGIEHRHHQQSNES
jgi:hypothetical protein